MQYRERSDRMVHSNLGLNFEEGSLSVASGRCARSAVLASMLRFVETIHDY